MSRDTDNCCHDEGGITSLQLAEEPSMMARAKHQQLHGPSLVRQMSRDGGVRGLVTILPFRHPLQDLFVTKDNFVFCNNASQFPPAELSSDVSKGC